MNECESISKEYNQFLNICDLTQGNNIEIIFGKLNDVFFDTKFDNNILNLVSVISSYFNKEFYITKESTLSGINDSIKIISDSIKIIKNNNLNYKISSNYLIKFNKISSQKFRNWSCEKNFIESQKSLIFNWKFDENILIKLISNKDYYNLKINIPVVENLKIKKNKEKIINDILLFFDKILSKIDLNDYKS